MGVLGDQDVRRLRGRPEDLAQRCRLDEGPSGGTTAEA
jgi:hypothetical protein